MALKEKLQGFITEIDPAVITAEREQALQPLVDYLQDKIAQSVPIQLNFICTHNSRRSCFAQIWAQVLAYHFGLKNVTCYSGGTEETTLHRQVLKTLRNSGLHIERVSSGTNPKYRIEYADDEKPILGFSKIWNHKCNPESNFAAIMTCAAASVNCPVISGAEKRISIPFEDPKHYDNTERQAAEYNAVNQQIVTALYAVYSKLK